MHITCTVLDQGRILRIIQITERLGKSRLRESFALNSPPYIYLVRFFIIYESIMNSKNDQLSVNLEDQFVEQCIIITKVKGKNLKFRFSLKTR